jgi:hypothetical protein
MDELLAHMLDAHGGLENWSNVSTLTAKLSLDGPFWAGRGWPDIYAGKSVELDAHREHTVFTPYTAAERSSILDVEPERVAIQTADGEVLERRTDPRSTYPMPFEPTTPWDALQVAYFTSYAVWNYLTSPFLLTYPGVQAQEIEPWDEDGESWRRLQVTFPETIATHNRDQVFYFDHIRGARDTAGTADVG